MSDIIIRYLSLPLSIRGVTVMDSDGNYNIYINICLSDEMQYKALQHEMKHIGCEHFNHCGDVYLLEKEIEKAKEVFLCETQMDMARFIN